MPGRLADELQAAPRDRIRRIAGLQRIGGCLHGVDARGLLQQFDQRAGKFLPGPAFDPAACKGAQRVAYPALWRASPPLDDALASLARRFLPREPEKRS